MGRFRKRNRHGLFAPELREALEALDGVGLDEASEVAESEQMLAPTYVTVGEGAAAAESFAPVLALEGLKPWDEIRGPALEPEAATPENGRADSRDPFQLELEAAAAEPRPVPVEAAAAVPAAGVGAGSRAGYQPKPVAPAFDDSGAGDEVVAIPVVADAEAAPAAAMTANSPAVRIAPMDDASSALAPRGEVEPEPAEAEAIEREEAEAEAAVAEPSEPEPVVEADPIELAHTEAKALAGAGRVHEAKRAYRAILADRPSHVAARNNLALLLEATGELAGALGELDRALELEPDNATLLVNRGALLGSMGRYAAAERDIKRVLRVEPSHGEALFNLGVVMTRKGLWAEAVPQLRRAVELDPMRGQAHYYLGEALNHVDDLAGAMAAYQRAAELMPENPRAVYGLGIVYDRMGRPDDAARMYRKSRSIGRR